MNDALQFKFGSNTMSMFGRMNFLSIVAISFLAPLPLLAETPVPWKVSGKLLGKPDGASNFKKAEDVSGIACDRAQKFPRLCLVADDEAQGTQIVILNDGGLVAGDYIKLTDASYEGKPLELDAEGVAYGDGSFFVVGSHGRPRHTDDQAKNARSNAKADATRKIYRVFLDENHVDMQSGRLKAAPKIEASSLSGNILAHPALAPSFDKALDDGGLTIEGVAVLNDELLVGLRSPVLGAKAAIASVPLAGIGDPKASIRVAELLLDKDTADGARGVRDLATSDRGILILAGPVQDPPKDRGIVLGDYSIYLWDGKASIKRLLDLPAFGPKTKPEALVALDADATTMRVLVLFDGPKEGEPRPVILPLP